MSKPKTPRDSGDIDARDLRIYRLKVTLRDTDPPIWRRLEVYAGMEMDSLAGAIDTVFDDFGDDWKHLIEVEKIAPFEPGIRYPRCTDGARANPLEDCGGPWDFADLVEAAGHSEHERFAELEDLGMAKWDPAKFSMAQVNRELTRVFRLKK